MMLAHEQDYRGLLAGCVCVSLLLLMLLTLFLWKRRNKHIDGMSVCVFCDIFSIVCVSVRVHVCV